MNWKGYNFSRNREFVIHKFTSSKSAHNLSKKYLANKENEFHVFKRYTKGI